MPTPAAAPAAPAVPATPAAPPADPKAPTGTPAPGSTLPVKPAPEPEAEFKPMEFVVDGKKIVIQNKDQLTRAIQKALYADQEIKSARQAMEGVKALKEKLKTPGGLREVLSDPDIGIDTKKLAIEWVREAMDEEKLTDEQRESRRLKAENEGFKKEKEAAATKAEQEKKAKEIQDKAAEFRTEIISAMQAHPDLPQDQMTMDACIQMMRAAYRRFQKVLPAAKAMEIVEKQYFDRLGAMVKAWPAEKIISRFGEEVLDKIQKVQLDKLRKGSDPKVPKTPPADPAANGKKKKDHLTEREWEALANQRIAGL